MNPKVSVIIATFNADKYIRKAIESFLSQTLESKELIIVDGASSDATISIANEYLERGVCVVSEADSGVYDAMNKGVSLAKGDWLYFLGADDFFMNEKVLESVFGNDHDDVDILYGDVYSVLLKRNYDGPTNKEKILFSNLCHQSIFYRKEVFVKAGLYNLNYRLFSDWEFNIRCFVEFEFRTKYIPVVIAEYAASGISTVNKDTKFLRGFLFTENLKYLLRNGTERLKKIRYYDQWWRLLRSMQVTDDLRGYANGISVPGKILKMYSFQKRFSHKVLFNGVFSKLLMTLSFLTNR